MFMHKANPEVQEGNSIPSSFKEWDQVGLRSQYPHRPVQQLRRRERILAVGAL